MAHNIPFISICCIVNTVTAVMLIKHIVNGLVRLHFNDIYNENTFFFIKSLNQVLTNRLITEEECFE